MKLEISVKDFVAGKLALEKVGDPSLSIHKAVSIVKENIFGEYLQDMEEYYAETSEVDYPAGMDAGHAIRFDGDIAIIRKWWDEYYEIRKELDKYLFGEKAL